MRGTKLANSGFFCRNSPTPTTLGRSSRRACSRGGGRAPRAWQCLRLPSRKRGGSQRPRRRSALRAEESMTFPNRALARTNVSPSARRPLGRFCPSSYRSSLAPACPSTASMRQSPCERAQETLASEMGSTPNALQRHEAEPQHVPVPIRGLPDPLRREVRRARPTYLTCGCRPARVCRRSAGRTTFRCGQLEREQRRRAGRQLRRARARQRERRLHAQGRRHGHVRLHQQG